MEDVQNRHDDREVAIDQVGVSDLRCPITVLDQNQGKQQTVARLSLSVSLPHHFKGTHMSRFVEVLEHHRGELTLRTMPSLLAELRERLDAESAHVEVVFPYFIEKSAPVTGAKGMMDFECAFLGTANGEATGDTTELVLRVTIPVTSLCPCSKEISDYGAHNQRGYVTISVQTGTDAEGLPEILWIEELIEVAEASASAPLYPLLKRPDERHVTMQAYENPAFVEDIVRNVAVRLKADPRVLWFEVTTVNHESIHNHNAFARVAWTRPSKN